MTKLGPDGTFPLGKPVNAMDRGGLRAKFEIIKLTRSGMINFGTPVSWLAMPLPEAAFFVEFIRQKIITQFGNLPYDKSTLPIKVVANHEYRIIELTLPLEAAILVANAEMWLALTEVVEEKMKLLTN